MKKTGMNSNTDFRALDRYKDYLSVKTNEIEEARLAKQYYHGEQWTEDEVNILRSRGQPVVTYNYVAQRINSIMGLLDRLRVDPKAYPRTPQGDQGAELASLALTYQMDEQRWREKFADMMLQCAMSGICAVALELIQGDAGDTEIGLAVVDPESFYYDPRSILPDFSDAAYMGEFRFMDLDRAVARWPDYETELRASARADWPAEFLSKTDRATDVNISGRERALIFDHWELVQGVWTARLETYDGCILEEFESPFRDEKGKPSCKFLPLSPFVDHESDRYSFFRNMKPLQDEINHRRSAHLHAISRRQIIMENGAVADVEELRRELHRKDGVIVRNPGLELDFARDNDEAKANAELLIEAKAEIQNFGPNDELAGEGGADQSGRAIQLRQQAGVIKLGPFMVSVSSWRLRVFRAVWNAIRQHWAGERWLRVTDDEGAIQMVPINQPQVDEFGMPTGQTINQISALDVDIILDEGPDQITAMQGTYDILIAMAQSGQQLPSEAIIEMSPLPASMKKKLVGFINEAKQTPPPELQMQQAKMQADQEAKQGEMQIKMAELEASLRMKEIDLQIKQLELAMKERDAMMQATAPAYSETTVQ